MTTWLNIRRLGRKLKKKRRTIIKNRKKITK